MPSISENLLLKVKNAYPYHRHPLIATLHTFELYPIASYSMYSALLQAHHYSHLSALGWRAYFGRFFAINCLETLQLKHELRYKCRSLAIFEYRYFRRVINVSLPRIPYQCYGRTQCQPTGKKHDVPILLGIYCTS